MSQCSFCGAKEQKVTPVCQSCGAPRYSITSNHLSVTDRHKKLKISATLAAVALIPGSFIALALIGAVQMSKKIKK